MLAHYAKDRKQSLLACLLLVLLAGVPALAFANHRSNGSGTCWASGAAWQFH